MINKGGLILAYQVEGVYRSSVFPCNFWFRLRNFNGGEIISRYWRYIAQRLRIITRFLSSMRIQTLMENELSGISMGLLVKGGIIEA
ncbi:hypothetical protein AV654_28585 [Paenibacillus elgii]|uniref:Uncharacterized protein n=1 Tax=Paenibacillus elgii TaxID=189691 RepID=A0A163VHS4_9BACL|nr:hypothetical protein AV654_28585 [Paenibacillus elgii]